MTETVTTEAEEAQELTDEQIARQDFVDNGIFHLVNELVPEKYRSRLPVEAGATGEGGKCMEWNIQWISDVREQIEGIIFDALNLPESERDAFELDFYAYLTPEEDE